MKTLLRNHVTALFLLAPAAITLAALPAAALAQPATPEVRALEVNSDRGVEPGSRLRFRLEGTPRAQASIRIRGVEGDIPLREVERGVYVGRHVVRRADRIEDQAPIRAILRSGNRTTTARYTIPPGMADVAAAPRPPRGEDDTRAPVIANLSPREGDTVRGGPNTVVSGNFEDRGGSGVDPNSVRIMLSGRNVTADAQVTPDSFTYRAPLPPGRHTVDVTARDRAGNAMRRSWSFEIASGPATVPIQILSHSNNAQVEGNVHVRGRTAPFASVNVKVDAVPPVVGQFGVAQRVFTQALQADAQGNFDFSFSSPFPIPGSRYDVSMTASKADVTTEARLVLFQRQG